MKCSAASGSGNSLVVKVKVNGQSSAEESAQLRYEYPILSSVFPPVVFLPADDTTAVSIMLIGSKFGVNDEALDA